MRYKQVHLYTEVTNNDLFKFCEVISNELRFAFMIGVKEGIEESGEDLNTYKNLDDFMYYMEHELADFGHSVIYRRNINIGGLKYSIRKILSEYKEGFLERLMPIILDLFKSFYTSFKEALLNIEAYEVLIILENKFKRLQKVLKHLEKELNYSNYAL